MKYRTSSERCAHRKETEATKDTASGVLDGITIFRFAHMWKNTSAGGVEAYLSNLNQQMLQRNKMRILQMHLAMEDEPCNIEIEHIGQGELVWIPSIFKTNQEQQITKVQRLLVRLRIMQSSQFNICHDLLLSTLANYQVNLAVFHWISEDSRTILDYCNKSRVPFVVINHFQNTRLKRRLIRKQISEARAIGGVSNVNVPSFIRSSFTNLSDGVDTDFFHPGKAEPLKRRINVPLVLLPSRITEEKGHLDALSALGCLSRGGISAILVFVGRLGSPAFMKKLQLMISEEGAQERVLFLGEVSSEVLRNWYAAATVVILPSYTEGLGKILLEAQAMERPVVAYDVGGVSEALCNDKSGFLVQKGDIAGLTRRFKVLLADQCLRYEMGKQGRQFVISRFSLEALTIRHEEFYVMNLNKCP